MPVFRTAEGGNDYLDARFMQLMRTRLSNFVFTAIAHRQVAHSQVAHSQVAHSQAVHSQVAQSQVAQPQVSLQRVALLQVTLSQVARQRRGLALGCFLANIM